MVAACTTIECEFATQTCKAFRNVPAYYQHELSTRLSASILAAAFFIALGILSAVHLFASGPFVMIFLAVFCCSQARSVHAHEVPNDVKIQAFIKPAGQSVSLLVRVPLEAMRDIEFPLRGPGYLNIAEAERELRDAAMLWIADDIKLYEEDTLLEDLRLIAVRVSLPSNTSFANYDTALAHTIGPALSPSTELYWQHAMLDVLFEYPIVDEISPFSIEPALARLGIQTTTILHYLTPTGSESVFQYQGNPGLVRLDPRWHQAALSFVRLGFEHVFAGVDHLLFLCCLVVPFRRVRPLIVLITSFTVAHSITLIAAGLDFTPSASWFPPLVEVLIALSIVYMALENIMGAKLHRRWVITFAFGLAHGFGFAFLLRESLQFAGTHFITSLFAFNIGIELGQLIFLATMLPLLWFVFRYLPAERAGIIVLSALIAHSSWHWLTARLATLCEFQFHLPAFNLLLLANAMRWLMLVIVLGSALWLLRGFVERWLTRYEPS